MSNQRGKVEMKFRDGTVIDSWLEFTLRESFIDPLGAFDLTVAPPRHRIDFYRKRIQKGEPVDITINGIPQASCLIQTVEMRIGVQRGVEFRIQCRSPLITPYQGAVDPKLTFGSQTDAPIVDVVLKALAPYGFTKVEGDHTSAINAKTGKALKGGRAPIIVEALKHQDAHAQDNETAYAFCARIANRLGVAIRPMPNGGVCVAAPNYEGEVGYSVGLDMTGALKGDRFVGDVVVTDTNDEQFSEYIVRGHRPSKRKTTRAAPPKGTTKPAELNTKRPQYRSEVAPHKPHNIFDKKARDAERCKNVAQFAMSLRAAEAFVVEGRVDGFVSKTGRIWTVDTLCDVFIEPADVNETLWILERTLTQTREGGQMTDLKLIQKGALVLGQLPSGA